MVLSSLRTSFVPVATDDWYVRRQKDPEGEFFNAMADQGPRARAAEGAQAATRQGIYVLSASGRFLGYAAGDVRPAALRRTLELAKAVFAGLPEAERRPEVPPLEGRDPSLVRRPPQGAIVLSVYARALDRARGKVCALSQPVTLDAGVRVPVLAQHDQLWILEREWRALFPSDARVGAPVAVPPTLAERFARFHLVDNTRGEPTFWTRGEVRALRIEAKVVAADAARVRLELEGEARLETADEPAKTARRFTGRILGVFELDRKADRVVRADLLAIGDHVGQGPFVALARRGPTPLGIACSLATGLGADLPPEGARELDDYLGGP